MRRVTPKPYPADFRFVSLQEWGKIIEAARTHAALRIEDCALDIGVSDNTWRGMEQGRPGIAAESYLQASIAVGIVLAGTPKALEQEPGKSEVER